MKKALVILLTASMLAVGCGSGSGGASSAAAPEAEEKVEEEAPQEEAEAEAAPEADAAAAEAEENLEVEASDALNAVSQAVDEAEQTEAAEQTEEAAEEAEAPATESLADNEEVLEGAQEVLSKTSAFTSDLGKSEKNDYGEQNLVDYSNGGYAFKIPANWTEQSGALVLEDNALSAAAISVTTQQNAMYGSLTSEQFAESAMEMDIAKDSDTGLENVDSSPVEIMDMMDGDKAVAQSFTGTSDGMDVEGMMIMGLDQEKSTLYVLVLIQSVQVQNSHFDDFKTFASTMTRE